MKRNPNLNSAESSLGTFLAQERYRSKKKKLVDFLERKSKAILSRKRHKQKVNEKEKIKDLKRKFKRKLRVL